MKVAPLRSPARLRARRGMSAVVRIALSLGVLATLVAVLGVRELRRADDVLGRAAEITERVDRVVALVGFENRLSAERQITVGLAFTDNLGIPVEVVDRMTGLDTLATRAERRAEADARLAALGGDAPVTNAAVVAGREAGPSGLATVVAKVSERRRQEVEALRAVVAAAGPGHGVGPALDTLDDAARLGLTVADLAIHYMDAAIGETGKVASVSALMVARVVTGELVTSLATRDGATAAMVRTFRDSGDYRILDEASAALVDRVIAGESTGTSVGELARLGEIGRAAYASQTLVWSAFDLATSNLRRVAADVSQRARDDVRRAWLVLVGSSLCAVVAMLWLARTVVRPIATLGRHAALVAAGEPPEASLAATGARELRVAVDQMNHLVESVRVVEQQAAALAAGAIDDPVLQRELPGRLGSAVSGAVRRLRSSIDESRTLNEQLAYDASHDTLTHLPNRRAALDALERASAHRGWSDGTVAVLFVDLDGFKPINDQHGHHAGDEVLATVAQRLADDVRPGDLVARLGGDEFLVLLPYLGSPYEVEEIRARLADAVSAPIELSGRGTEVAVGASVGVAFPEPGESAEALLKRADAAMYAVKARRVVGPTAS